MLAFSIGASVINTSLFDIKCINQLGWSPYFSFQSFLKDKLKKKTERKQKKNIISTIADGRYNSITAGLVKNTLPDIKSGVRVGKPDWIRKALKE